MFNSLWPMDCSTPRFSVHHQLPELIQTYVHWVSDVIQPSHPLSSPSLPALQSFPASGPFPMSQLFESGGQSIGASVSASVLPMNIQGWFPLGLVFDLLVVQGTSYGGEFWQNVVHWRRECQSTSAFLREPHEQYKKAKRYICIYIYSIYKNICLSGCTGLSGGMQDLLVVACGI